MKSRLGREAMKSRLEAMMSRLGRFSPPSSSDYETCVSESFGAKISFLAFVLFEIQDFFIFDSPKSSAALRSMKTKIFLKKNCSTVFWC